MIGQADRSGNDVSHLVAPWIGTSRHVSSYAYPLHHRMPTTPLHHRYATATQTHSQGSIGQLDNERWCWSQGDNNIVDWSSMNIIDWYKGKLVNLKKESRKRSRKSSRVLLNDTNQSGHTDNIILILSGHTEWHTTYLITCSSPIVYIGMHNLRDCISEGQHIVTELLGAIFEMMDVTKS